MAERPERGGAGRSPVAWAPARDLDAREWIAAGQRLGAVGRCIQWVLGDWLAYGNEKFGERYARAAKITGYDTQTLMNMVYVASRYDVSRRREKLSWSHHETLAALPVETQEHWLGIAAERRWSVADLRTMLRQSRSSGEEEAGIEEGPPAADPIEPGVVMCPRCRVEVPISPAVLALIAAGPAPPQPQPR